MRSIQIYKPNPRASGSAIGFSCSVNQRSGKVESYVNIFNQVSWDAKTRRASFKTEDGSNQIAIKLSIFELGSLIRTMTKGEELSTVHKSDSGTTSIKFNRYSTEKSKGYSFSASREGNKFSCSLTPSEAVVLEEFCRAAIQDMIVVKD
jgi:hypothetical protein